MNFLIILAALTFLILIAYRGYSVILFAPVAALAAVLLTDPSLVGPMYSNIFMVRMADFIRNYFPVFLLGAIFGKVIELSGFSKAIVVTVIGMTKTWAKELGRKNINVNAVAPGFILTEMTMKMPANVLNMMKEKGPLHKLGTPEDVANACLFLASDESDFIHGAVISVDGGIVI